MKSQIKLWQLVIFFLFSSPLLGQVCENGDCQNSYGMLNNEGVEFYHGFFKDGKYHGVGYLQNKTGAYYMSEFNNGKVNGYTVYNDTGILTGGVFKDGVKDGIHIEFHSIPNTIKRTAITYENGKEVSRETIIGDFKSPDLCKAGDCENGFGIKFDGSMLVTAIWEFGDMKHGQLVNVREGVEKMMMIPSMDNMQAKYLVYENVPVEQGKLEVASMYNEGKNDGEYIVVNIAMGQMGAALFKDGERVKKFEIK